MNSNEIYRYYINENNNDRLFKAKLRYIIYGAIILVLAITLFILEAFYGFGITQVLDYFISISMFVDMGIGIIYIIKGILLRDGIRANFFFNMTNAKIVDNKIKSSPSMIRILSIVPVIFNISIIVFYISTMYYKPDQMSIVLIISFVVGILLEIAALMAMFSLDNELEIYDKVENFSQNVGKNI